ncbi:L10-interacting MYB domain-containing protein-like [Olea europaea var. sylvestris]|uniref:L10-interacting MYB domain-containing protein-like n=1 Tax=Olea europaea var. sylvestris TaxID=158386 RepID=UPI000C1D3FFA|nr:L10-interacting MYB domain-containing protein-like [Olea europaea var. sylvestris]
MYPCLASRCFIYSHGIEVDTASIYFIYTNYTTQNPDSMPVPSAKPNMENRPEPRKCARWEPREQKIFLSAAEHVTAEGHRRGKCFSSTWWERLRDMFNQNSGKNWTTAQLKNHWGAMRTDHKLLFELLQSTGIACGLSTGGRIDAPEWWWTQKIKENPRYGKFKDNDNTEIYHKYSRLFGGSCDSMKYALTPTKLSQRGFALGGNSDSDDQHDTLPINAETTDSSDGPTPGRASSSMNISRGRSGEKRKGKHAKGKRKKFGAREVSESVDNLACASREMASAIRAKEEGRMTLHECIDDLLSTGLVEARKIRAMARLQEEQALQ